MSMDQPPLRPLLQWQHTRIVGMAAMKLVKSPPLAKPNLRLAAMTPPALKQEHLKSMDQPPLRLLHTRIAGTAMIQARLIQTTQPPSGRATTKLVTNLPLAKLNLQLAATKLPAPKPGHRMSMDQPPLRRQHTRIAGTAMTQARLIQTTQPPSGRATTRRVARTSLAMPSL
jgi:hypothetical protein